MKNLTIHYSPTNKVEMIIKDDEHIRNIVLAALRAINCSFVLTNCGCTFIISQTAFNLLNNKFS